MSSQRPAIARLLVYGVAVGAVLAVTAAMLLIGIAVRVQAFPLVYVLLVGLIARMWSTWPPMFLRAKRGLRPGVCLPP